MERIPRFLSFLIVGCITSGCALVIGAQNLVRISDTIVDSAPNASTTHTIVFTTNQSIPPSGSIVITPHADVFTIPVGFSEEDIDIAVNGGGSFVDRSVAASPSAIDDGVTVVPGINGSVTVTLNASTGIMAGEEVKIELGTHSSFGSNGDTDIQNPADIGSYRIDIETRDIDESRIDFGRAMIAVIAPVGITARSENVPPTRSSGLPSGIIAAGNSNVEISLLTDEIATCRYATSSDVDYQDMTATFTAVGGILHIATLTGFVNNTAYVFHVRCVDTFGASNQDDFDISFTLDETPISNTSIAGSSGVSSGSVSGGSPVLFLSKVTISGLAPPQSSITLLKDGVYTTQTRADSGGKFSATVSGLERGNYTFQVYATDSGGRKSAPVSSTITLRQGTNNVIAGLLIPPTLALSSSELETPADIRAFGEGILGSEVELKLGSQGKRYTMNIPGDTQSGEWEIIIPAKDITRGSNSFQATNAINSRISAASTPVSLVVGTGAVSATGSSDINGDGKVNLVDFSIFLLSWNTNESAHDLNADGTVNLADFSILLFNWTG